MELLVQGRKAFAATGGKPFDPALPAVAFVHGAGMDHTVWALQTRYFANHGRAVLAVDLPGHGRSAGPSLGSIEKIGAWLLDLIAAAGASRVALVGHSMGAIAALEAAAQSGRYAPAIDRLALLGVAARMPVHPDLLKAAAAGDHGALDMMVGWGLGKRAQMGGYVAPGLWLAAGSMRLLERGAADVLASDLSACNAYGRGLEAAGEIACPVLLLVGEGDRMTPGKAAVELAKRIRDGRTVVLKQAGHLMMIEQPGETLDALTHFI
ncbi:MAG: alpha/beta hydrolase [Alphaproteobacteria bacterium]|nr:alpha/beta hydrolase [Alphaproteobacteria bacterium]